MIISNKTKELIININNTYLTKQEKDGRFNIDIDTDDKYFVYYIHNKYTDQIILEITKEQYEENQIKIKE